MVKAHVNRGRGRYHYAGFAADAWLVVRLSFEGPRSVHTRSVHTHPGPVAQVVRAHA
jgi:hypothetical protein